MAKPQEASPITLFCLLVNLTLMYPHLEKVMGDRTGINHNISFHQKQIISANIVL